MMLTAVARAWGTSSTTRTLTLLLNNAQSPERNSLDMG